jgi:multiple sugar transport system substrate-binding protein
VPEPTKPTTVTFESWVGDSVTMKKLAKQFEKLHPMITVKFENVSADTATTKLQTEIAGGTAPDVVYMDSGQVSNFAARDALLNLQNFISRTPSLGVNDFLPAWRASATYKGAMYGLPFDGETTGLFYRTDLFRAAGITSPPTTWSEFQADAAKLTIPSKKQYGFVIFGPESAYYWYPWLYQAGGQLLTDNNKKIAFDSPAGIKAADFFIGLRKYSPPDFYNSNSWDGRVTFATGKVAMYEAGAWFAGTMQGEFPKINGKWAVAPLPQDQKCATTIAGDTLVIMRQSKNADAAWKWITFLTSPKNMAYWNVGTKASSLLPPRASLINNPGQTFKKNPVLKGFANMMKCGITTNLSNPAWPKVENDLNNEFSKAIYGKETPAQALANAAKEGQGALAQGA